MYMTQGEIYANWELRMLMRVSHRTNPCRKGGPEHLTFELKTF